jgi:hypothetical protein
MKLRKQIKKIIKHKKKKAIKIIRTKFNKNKLNERNA